MTRERAQGLFWMVVGGAIFYGSWTMDRLANLGVKPFSAPGLLPGILGIFVFVLGVAMLLRSAPSHAQPLAWRRVLVPLALCLGFAGGLVGRGLPFWLAAWLFVALMIWTLQRREGKPQPVKLALVALAIGGAASVVITLVFQELFLVRLP